MSEWAEHRARNHHIMNHGTANQHQHHHDAGSAQLSITRARHGGARHGYVDRHPGPPRPTGGVGGADAGSRHPEQYRVLSELNKTEFNLQRNHPANWVAGNASRWTAAKSHPNNFAESAVVRDERDGVHRSRPLHPMEGDQRWRLRSDNSSADCLAFEHGAAMANWPPPPSPSLGRRRWCDGLAGLARHADPAEDARPVTPAHHHTKTRGRAMVAAQSWQKRNEISSRES